MTTRGYIWVPGYTKKNGTKVDGHYRAPSGPRKRAASARDVKSDTPKPLVRRNRYPRFFSSQ